LKRFSIIAPRFLKTRNKVNPSLIHVSSVAKLNCFRHTLDFHCLAAGFINFNYRAVK
jgi:hypothetical protein